jgi:hypothetical protein
LETLASSISSLREAGAEFVTGGQPGKGPGFCFQNTLLRVSGNQFLKSAPALQTEAFGNATLGVVVDGLEQAKAVAARLEVGIPVSRQSAFRPRCGALLCWNVTITCVPIDCRPGFAISLLTIRFGVTLTASGPRVRSQTLNRFEL